MFKQYIPDKSHKYAIDMYKLADTEEYTWNFVFYTGQQGPMTGLGHAQTVVMNLLDDLIEVIE